MMLTEPDLWKNTDNYYLKVLESDWYKLLVKMENLITTETVNFYASKGIMTMHLPVTTGSISSPMGKGSDSLPVKVNLNGIDTYLADSMQFLLEYGCRLTNNGVYYIMPSFRGEQADERHLCQFYQKLDKQHKGRTKNADLLMGIGETVGCGERNETYLELLEALKKHEVDPKEYEWYITMKQKFPMKTSGFGMGIERFLMWVLKCSDIRNMQICLRINGKYILP